MSRETGHEKDASDRERRIGKRRSESPARRLRDSWQEPPRGRARLRIPRPLYDVMKADLRRPHAFAAERVGFLFVGGGNAEGGEVLAIGAEYRSVADDHYVEDWRSGARINGDAIRAAMQHVLDTGRGAFHVHLHDHPGVPGFSGMDRDEQPRLVRSLRNVGRDVPHGMLVLSDDSAAAWVWLPGEEVPIVPGQITIVGYPTALIVPRTVNNARRRAAPTPNDDLASDARNGRFSRQTFLGVGAQAVLERARLGVVGLGGGGSHIVQQLSHLGVRHFRVFDGDTVDESNLNRLVGARAADVRRRTPKTTVAKRLITGLTPRAKVEAHAGRWQERPELLRGCDVVFGCVDTFAERRELEVACRRFGMAYVDIGMDVHQVGEGPPRMAGQVILSVSGGPCMFCLGFLNDARLAQEAALYGAAGGRPQVVWPNGVLASTAVGVAVDVLTGWTRTDPPTVYLSYDGNTGLVTPHVRLHYLDAEPCPHYPLEAAGAPVFRRVRSPT